MLGVQQAPWLRDNWLLGCQVFENYLLCGERERKCIGPGHDVVEQLRGVRVFFK